MTVDLIFTVAQLCWIDMLFLLSVFWGSLTSNCTPLAPSVLLSLRHHLAWSGTILVWGSCTSSDLGGTAPECPLVAQACLKLLVFQRILFAVSVFWFGNVFFCFKRWSDEPEIKIPITLF